MRRGVCTRLYRRGRRAGLRLEAAEERGGHCGGGDGGLQCRGLDRVADGEVVHGRLGGGGGRGWEDVVAVGLGLGQG